MKKAIFISMMLAAFAFVSVSNIRAQVAGLYRADIPFDFSVGKKQYPAGRYNVEIRGAEKRFFVLRDSRGGGAYMVNTSPEKKPLGEERAALDFQRIGSGYYLRSIQALDLTSTLPIMIPGEGLAKNQAKDKVTILLGNGR